MWGRVIEILTATYLALSPFYFRAQHEPNLVLIDSLIALLIVVLSGISFWRPTGYAHFAILLVAAGLAAWGRFAEPTPLPPVHQNHIVVGLFLMMIAVIPNEASLPPLAWRPREQDADA